MTLVVGLAVRIQLIVIIRREESRREFRHLDIIPRLAMNGQDLDKAIPLVTCRSIARQNRSLAIEVFCQALEPLHLLGIRSFASEDEDTEAKIRDEQVPNRDWIPLGCPDNLEGLEAGPDFAILG